MLLSDKYTVKQAQDIISFNEDIISNMDEHAMKMLLSGGEEDVDRILEMMFEEAHSILNMPNRKVDSSKIESLDPLVETLEETLRKASLSYFIVSTMPDFDVNWHHLEWGNLAQIYSHLGIEAARGHGKSYYYSKAFPLWKMYRYQKNTSLKKAPKDLAYCKEGMIITNEYKLANHLLGKVKEEIEENDILRKVLMPDKKSDGWAAEGIKCRNGAVLSAKSVGSKMRGLHPNYIVCDDYLNDQVLYSMEQNKKYIDHFNSVTMNLLEPGGQIVVVGTPFREDDLYAELKKSKMFRMFEYPGIFPNGRVLWEGRHSFQSLLDKRQMYGSMVFSREILVRPISTASSLFPYPTIKECFNNNTSIIKNIHSSREKFKKVVIGCDFAISANIGADFSVFTVVGVDERDHYHILDIWRKSGATYDEQVGSIKRMYQDFQPDVLLVEDNGMQKIFVQMLNDQGVPAQGQTTSAKNKYDLHQGIPNLAALFEQGRIHIPRGNQMSQDITDVLVQELSTFTWDENKGKIQGIGAHDDCPMSLWIAIKATKIGAFNWSFL